MGKPKSTTPVTYTCPAFQNEEQARKFWENRTAEILVYDGYSLEIDRDGKVLRYDIKDEG
jgi:hypothetical protein